MSLNSENGTQRIYQCEDGSTFYCEGERHVRTDYPDGTKAFFLEHRHDGECFVRFEFTCGTLFFLTYKQGEWCLKRSVHTDGCVREWRKLDHGDQSMKPAIKYLTKPDGSVFSYKGSSGYERIYRSITPEGHVYHYEGERGHERKVFLALNYGSDDDYKIHFAGERGFERKVRTTYEDGSKKYWKGECGHERAVRVVHPDGSEDFLGWEKLRRVWLPAWRLANFWSKITGEGATLRDFLARSTATLQELRVSTNKLLQQHPALREVYERGPQDDLSGLDD